MTTRSKTLLSVALPFVLAALLAPPPAEAIPAFARKYQFSCSTCHAPAPRLKQFGEDFAARGFRLEDPEQEPSRADYDTGDPLLKLVRTLPLAARLEGYTAYQEDAAAETDFETPWVFKILSGGPISEKISYYFYFIVEENSVEGLEDAYLQFNSLFDSRIDLIFGQFQVSDPLFKRELRLERNDYAIYKAHVGAASANLTYDRGLVFSTSTPGEVDVVLEVVNGNGIPKGEFDNDNNKNLALRLARRFGAVRVGVFGYLGKEEGRPGVSDDITYFGPDLSWDVGDRWQLNLQYLERRDDNPFFLGRGAVDVVTKGGFGELHYFPRGQDERFIVSGLYNKIDSDDPAAIVENISLTLSYLMARNIRMVTEIGRDLEAEASSASLGVVAAF